MDPFRAELEKLANVKTTLGAALLSGLAAGSAIRSNQKPQYRTDQIVRAQRGMTADEFKRRELNRKLTAGAGAIATGAAVGLGMAPARKALVSRAQRFVTDVAEPTLARIDEVAAAASKRHADDIVAAATAKSGEVGESFGKGVRSGLDFSSIFPDGKIRSVLGRFAGRG